MQGYADQTLGTTSRVRTRRTASGDGQPRHLTALLEASAFVLDHRYADRRRAADAAAASTPHARRASDHGATAHDLPAIGHIAVAASGVWVIASRRVLVERVSLRRSLIAPPRLRVGHADRTELLTLLDRQRSALCAALADQPHVPIHTAVCIIGGQFPLLGSLSTGGHLIVPPSDLIANVAAGGPLRRGEARRIAALLDQRLG